MTEQSPPRHVGNRDAPEMAAVDIGNLVVPGQPLVEIREISRQQIEDVAIFAPDADITRRDKKVARAAAYCDGGKIIIETRNGIVDGGALHQDAPSGAQAAAALAAFTLHELHPNRAVAATATG